MFGSSGTVPFSYYKERFTKVDNESVGAIQADVQLLDVTLGRQDGTCAYDDMTAALNPRRTSQKSR